MITTDAAPDLAGIAERWFTRGWRGEVAMARDIFSESVKTNGYSSGSPGQ